MQVRLLKSKLHMAAVTQTRLDYHGSVTIDRELVDAVGLLPYEMVIVANVATGHRAETYVLPGDRGKREVQLNGAMARLAQPGDRVIIFSYAFLDPREVEGHKPVVAVLDAGNRIVDRWEG